VIPAFNEAAVIGDVVQELRERGLAVVVVDDGSADATAVEARKAGATALRHALNRGQGAALQTGIDYCLARGARVLVTFDADGQHASEDIPRLVRPVLDGTVDVVLGSRFLGTTENMPARRRALLKAAVLFTRLYSRARITDVHNGLRVFSWQAASRIRITQDRMAHASELIDQIVGSGLSYQEVPVHVRYTEYSRAKGQRTSGAFKILVDYLLGDLAR
jgi:glycosyltransferase involved in cell wall biosynthesis